jgi:hypothetical protein
MPTRTREVFTKEIRNHIGNVRLPLSPEWQMVKFTHIFRGDGTDAVEESPFFGWWNTQHLTAAVLRNLL